MIMRLPVFYNIENMQNMEKYAKYANAIKCSGPGAREHTPHDDYSSGNKFHLLC